MKNIKIFFIAILSSLFTVSCLVDDEKSQIEDDLASTPYVVGFNATSRTVNYLTDGATVELKQPVDLIGGSEFTSTPEQVVSFEIDASSTAVPGTDYDLVSSSSIAIPADRDFENILFNIYTGAIDVDDPKTIVINLLTSSNGVVADQFKTITIIINGTCFSDVSGTYDVAVEYTHIDLTVTNHNFPGEVITEIDTATYVTETTGHWTAADLAPAPRGGFIFTENCGDIFIESQSLGDYWANTVEAPGGPGTSVGTVDPVTGDIHMEYNVCFGGDCRQYVVDYTKL